MDQDPAIAIDPVVTTAIDMLGVLVYFFILSIFFLRHFQVGYSPVAKLWTVIIVLLINYF